MHLLDFHALPCPLFVSWCLRVRFLERTNSDGQTSHEGTKTRKRGEKEIECKEAHAECA